MEEKKLKEISILNKIYSESKYKKVTKRENPDFEIEHSSGYKFGVEIIELYFSESNARIKNIPYYVSNILSNKNYKHKDDIVKLEVRKLTVISDGKLDKEIEGIIQELPPKDDLINMITEIIINKCKKYDNYDEKLGHINLIIYDMENRYHNIQREDFYRYFFNQDLVSSIKNSPFREIFFITELSNKKQYYFPLRLILLMSEIYLLNGFLTKNKHYLLPSNEYKDEKIIYTFLLGQGIHTASLIESEHHIELLYSNYGVLINDKSNSITLHDYAEYPLPNQKSITEKKIKQIDKTIISQYLMFKEKNIFEGNIGYEVNEFSN